MKSLVVTVCLGSVLACGAFGAVPVDPLEAGFRDPPASARPITFWHWMNGCVTKEGITADLESYKRVGLAGTEQFLVGGTEAVLDDPSVAVLNDKWQELFRFAVSESARLGLEFGTHNSPGWSSSGFPTVPVEDSMQKLVFGEAVQVVGPARGLSGSCRRGRQCGTTIRMWRCWHTRGRRRGLEMFWISPPSWGRMGR